MFPITHIWFAEKLLKTRDSGLILGAVFPDIVITGCLDYKQTHYCGWPLYEYLKKEAPSFAKGMITHTIAPRGLDYYGDESYGQGYKGYCFQKGQQIVDAVVKACHLPQEFGLWKAHNFIEMGIELNLLQESPGLAEALHGAFCDEAALQQAGELLESYFDLKKYCINESFKRFSEYIELENSNSYKLAAKYDMQMRAKHGISIDIPRAAEIIEDSRSLVQEDFPPFIEACSSLVLDLFEGGDKNE